MTDPFGRPESSEPSAAGSALDPAPRPVASPLVPLGLLVVLLGAVALAVGLFLPLAASPDSRVELIENRAIWYTGTDVLLGIAVAAPFFAVLRWRGLPLPWWLASAFGVIALLAAGLAVLLLDAGTLHDVAWTGPSQPESDELRAGIGVWVSAAGAVALIAGGALLQAVGPPLPRKQEAAAAATAPEGWYPDPEGTELRWWDGTRWGDSRRPAPPSQTPSATPLGGFAPPVAPRTLWRRPDGDGDQPPQGG